MKKGKPIDFERELKKPRLVAFLFADYASSTTDGKAVIGGVFERIFVEPLQPEKPQIVYQFFIFLKVVEADKSSLDIHSFSPAGELLNVITLQVAEGAVIIDNEPNHIQAVLRVGLEFKQPGVHWFDVRYQDVSIGMVPLIVQLQPQLPVEK
jgi:hypothetical protein